MRPQSLPVVYANVKLGIRKSSSHSAFTLHGKVLVEAFILLLKILIFGSKNDIPLLLNCKLW